MKNRLKELREALGKMKQREFAERLGVSTGLVGQWETGKPIGKSILRVICEEFNVRREWLENGTGEMFEPGKSDQELLKESALRLFNQLSEEGKKAVVEALREELKIGSLPSEKQREIDEWNRRIEEANRNEANRGIEIRNSQIEKVVNNQR